jgi:phosphate starvation-inducible PhoH-like protein
MAEQLTITLDVASIALAQRLVGADHRIITRLERLLGVTIHENSTVFKLMGDADAVKLAQHALNGLIEIAGRRDIDDTDVTSLIDHLKTKSGGAKTDQGITTIATRKKNVAGKTVTQSQYIDAMRKYPLVFGVGPAGTGKTYLAVAHAVKQLEDGKVDRLILTRPAVEAGEKLGFLPGDLKEKVDPFLRPIYDALFDLMGAERMEKATQAGQIEIAPLAFMRGRTLSNAAVIVDESQNTTAMQMKMV